MFTKKISQEEKLFFIKHLSMMISAGLNLHRSLLLIQKQTKNPYLQEIISSLLAEIANGKKLSESMMKYPKVFPALYISIIEAGENGGTLKNNLFNLSLQIKKEYEVKRKVRGALMYPTFILWVTAIIGIVMTYFVLPRVEDLLLSFHKDLPFLSKVLIETGPFIRTNIYWIILAVIAFWLIRIWIRGIPSVMRLIDIIKFRIPIFGELQKKVLLARLIRMLGTLLESGLPIVAVLQAGSRMVNNALYKEALLDILAKVEEGEALSIALDKYKNLFGLYVPSMIMVGEETGSLSDSLLYLADYYEEDVDNQVKSFLQTLEPLLLVIIGLIVGLFAIAIITPIYRFTGSIV